MFKGAASIRSTLFKNNWAWYGGALALQGGTLTIADSWFDSNGYDQNNVFRTSSGGGIFINGGMASLVDVTLSGNRSISFGSGLAASSVLTMTNVTVSGNVSQSLYSGAVYLGGYSNNYFNNVTIAQNGGVPVGGIYIEPIAGLVMRNTIVADNTGANCNAPIPGSINNLSTDASCGFGAGRDSILIPLAPLANTGGFAPTHSPLAGSPAIDGGLAVYCPYTDQRGVVRAGKGATCDVGAVEYVGNGIGIDVDGNGTYDAATDGLLLLRYLFGLRGPALTNGAVGPGATRTGAQIEAYIQSLMQQ